MGRYSGIDYQANVIGEEEEDEELTPFLPLALASIGRMEDSWTVFFLELLYVFIPLLALFSVSSLPHRLNRIRHYFNPIDNPIEAVPPTVPVTAPKRARTPVLQGTPMSSELDAIFQELENVKELRSDREVGMVGEN